MESNKRATRNGKNGKHGGETQMMDELSERALTGKRPEGEKLLTAVEF